MAYNVDCHVCGDALGYFGDATECDICGNNVCSECIDYINDRHICGLCQAKM